MYVLFLYVGSEIILRPWKRKGNKQHVDFNRKEKKKM